MSQAYFEEHPLTLNNIALDIQILICTLLHPSDILALRKTCKTLQLLTRRGVVWMAALRRVCLDNCLFLPSFPILDMSDEELEHAAMAPRRWIELQKQRPNGSDATLRPRTTRIIEDSSLVIEDNPELFIVPDGRYMVSYSERGIHVWDFGYTSSSDCKLIASVELEDGPEDWQYSYMAQATPDGMGLIFLAAVHDKWSVYEIYPHSETPQLTRIAYLDLRTVDPPYLHCLLHDRAVFWYDYDHGIGFRIWDYRLNHSIAFLGDNSKFKNTVEMIATKTAIIILFVEEILIWAIPPLSPQPPNYFDHNPTHIPPLFRIALPGGIVSHGEFVSWNTMSHWYYGSSQPLYFDMRCRNLKLHTFEIIVKPDLFDPSLRFINTKLIPCDFDKGYLQMYRTCEDTLVALWESSDRRNNDQGQCGAYTGVTSSHDVPASMILLPTTTRSLCPASGRYVYFDKNIRRLVIADLF